MAAFLPCKLVQDHAAFLPSYARMTVRKPIWTWDIMSVSLTKVSPNRVMSQPVKFTGRFFPKSAVVITVVEPYR